MEGAAATAEERAGVRRFAATVLLFAEFMLFAGWLGGVIVLRAGVAAWAGPGVREGLAAVFPVACATTAALACGAVLQRRFPLLAPAGGLLFLAGEGWQWHRLREAGIGLHGGDLFPTVFYASGALVALHVLLGLVWGAIGRFGGDLGLYWKFLAGVRLVFFLVLYVLV